MSDAIAESENAENKDAPEISDACREEVREPGLPQMAESRRLHSNACPSSNASPLSCLLPQVYQWKILRNTNINHNIPLARACKVGRSDLMSCLSGLPLTPRYTLAGRR